MQTFNEWYHGREEDIKDLDLEALYVLTPLRGMGYIKGHPLEGKSVCVKDPQNASTFTGKQILDWADEEDAKAVDTGIGKMNLFNAYRPVKLSEAKSGW